MLERVYRLLLMLYPPSFRRRYGDQMLDDFREMRKRGIPLTHSFLDLAKTVPGRWRDLVADAFPRDARRSLVLRTPDAVRTLARALRSLRRRPGFALVVVVSLGVGIGASTAVFSWTEGLVLRPLPAVDDLSSLVSIEVGDPTRPNEEAASSFPDFVELRDGLTDGARLAAFGFGQFSVARTADVPIGSTERFWGAFVTPEYFRILGIDPVLGRLDGVTESQVPQRAAFISEALWTRLMARNPGVIGAQLHIDGREFDVLGVVPADFSGTVVGLRLDVWLLADAAPDLWGEADLLHNGSRRWLRVFGRLEPGTSRSSIDREVRETWARLEREHVVDEALEARAVPLDIGVAARLRPLLAILLGLAAFMLLAVCTNVANLTLMRGAARDHEVAVMRALGADRAQVASTVLGESVLLGVLGIAFGLAVASLGADLLPAVLPPTPLPLNLQAPMDFRVFLFCATLGFGAALVSGAAPALRAVRSDPLDALRGRGAVSRRSAIQHSSLIVAQLALSLGTLVAAGFFFNRLEQLQAADRGFRDPEAVVLFTTDLSEDDARTAWESGRLDDLLSSVRGIADVRSAAVASFVPLGFVGYASLDVEVPSGTGPDASATEQYLVNRVGPGYFDLMGTSILSGRPIDSGDQPGAAVAVVVNETFVRRHWPGLDPIGKSLILDGREATVVGVAIDGKYRFDHFDEPAPPFLYVSWPQWPSTSLTLHIRVERPGVLDEPAVRRALELAFPSARLTDPMSLDEYTSIVLVPVRLGASVVGALGVLAILLAAMGLYAIMAFRVRERMHEVGLRLAVGAGAGQIVTMFVSQGARTAIVGVAFGFPIVLAIHRIFETLIPGFMLGWESLYLTASIAMLVVALTAVSLAARKAGQIAPTEALRSE